jgi:outer membrane biosynthesis protein TonB
MRNILVGATAAMTLLGAAVLATAHAQDDKSNSAAPEGKGTQRGPASGESERAKQPQAPSPKAERRDDGSGKGAQGSQDRPQPKATQQQQRQPDRDQSKTTQPQHQENDRPKAAQQQQQRDRDRAKATEQQDKDRPKATQQQRKDDQPKAAEGKDRPDAKGERARTQVTEQNRRSAGDRIRQTRVERVQRSRINVNVNIGARIPRSVRLHVMPVVIYDVAPAYRGYSYVLLDDDTILIVDSATYEIIDVIPAGSLRADLPGRSLILSAEQTRFVFSSVPRDRTADVRVRLALGAEVPRSVELLAFPEEVTGRIGELSRYRYVVAEGDVVVVDPNDHAVVLVISN